MSEEWLAERAERNVLEDALAWFARVDRSEGSGHDSRGKVGLVQTHIHECGVVLRSDRRVRVWREDGVLDMGARSKAGGRR
jgi:hypothetical protein